MIHCFYEKQYFKIKKNSQYLKHHKLLIVIQNEQQGLERGLNSFDKKFSSECLNNLREWRFVQKSLNTTQLHCMS